ERAHQQRPSASQRREARAHARRYQDGMMAPVQKSPTMQHALAPRQALTSGARARATPGSRLKWQRELNVPLLDGPSTGPPARREACLRSHIKINGNGPLDLLISENLFGELPGGQTRRR